MVFKEGQMRYAQRTPSAVQLSLLTTLPPPAPATLLSSSRHQTQTKSCRRCRMTKDFRSPVCPVTASVIVDGCKVLQMRR